MNSQEVKKSRFVSVDKEWNSLPFEGVFVKELYKFLEGGSTVLIKMEPNSAFPIHDHPADEEVYVIEGECKVGKYSLVKGDYLNTSKHTIHAPFTRQGCTLLARTTEPLKFIK